MTALRVLASVAAIAGAGLASGVGSASRLFATQAEPQTLAISHRARAVAPGEVVLVDVHAPLALHDVQAKWMSQVIFFYEVQPKAWRALVPIDVAASAGRQVLTVQAKAPDNRAIEQAYPIVVAPRTFPARRITVDSKFVDPPSDELERIERERKTVEGIFARPTRERYWSQPFVVPVPGTATSSFGRRSIINGAPRAPHTGTDFQAATGTPVVAPNRGRIALAADQYFPGNTIIIDHGLGVYSYLAHLSKFTVEEGAMVERGQRIALSGATGRVTGPHLHWTMRMGSARVDPLSVIALIK